jgi:HD-like signal output (HDOD) protein
LPYLDLAHPSKRWAQDRMLPVLTFANSFPTISTAVLKLAKLVKEDDIGIDELSDIIRKEPGLAANCIRVASASRYGLGVVRSIHDAVLRLGTQEIRRIAASLGVMQRFDHLRVKVDWNRFWLHSLLVARISEQIASAFRQANGSEYLAGLLHDSGKLVIEHYFPQEFESILQKPGAVGAIACRCIPPSHRCLVSPQPDRSTFA